MDASSRTKGDTNNSGGTPAVGSAAARGGRGDDSSSSGRSIADVLGEAAGCAHRSPTPACASWSGARERRVEIRRAVDRSAARGFANGDRRDDAPAMIKGAPKTTKGRWRRFVHALMKTLRGALLLQDTPHRIALGCACGIFFSPLPTLGQTFIGMILAKLAGGNVIASLPWSWISNPFTTVPSFFGGHRGGR